MSWVLLDPAGAVRATVQDPSDREALVSGALGLASPEMLVVLGEGQAGWTLGTFRPGFPVKAASLGVRLEPGADQRRETVRATLMELAWLELLDDGWRLEARTKHP